MKQTCLHGVLIALLFFGSFVCAQRPAEVKFLLVGPYTVDEVEDHVSFVIKTINITNANNALLPETRITYAVVASNYDSQAAVHGLIEKLPELDSYVAVVGAPWSSITIDMQLVLKKSRIVHISQTATSPSLSNTAKYPAFCRGLMSDEFGARLYPSMVLSVGYTSIISFSVNTAFGIGIVQEFAVNAKQKGLSVVGQYTFESEDLTDEGMAPHLKILRENGVRAIFLTTQASQGHRMLEILDRADMLDGYVWFTNGNVAYTDLDPDMAARQEGFFTMGYGKEPAIVDQLLATTELGPSAPGTMMAWYGYEAVMVLANALHNTIEDAVTRGENATASVHDRALLLQAVKDVEYESVTGTVSYDDNCERLGKMELQSFDGSKWVTAASAAFGKNSEGVVTFQQTEVDESAMHFRGGVKPADIDPNSVVYLESADFPLWVVPIIIGAFLIVLVVCALLFRRHKRKTMTAATNQTRHLLNADDLEFGEIIGEGSFGSVYKGRYKGIDVAIKTLKFDDASRSGSEVTGTSETDKDLQNVEHQLTTVREKLKKTKTMSLTTSGSKSVFGSRNSMTQEEEDFLAELDVLSRLRSPNILLYMGCVTKPALAIVTELMQGSLFEILQKSSKVKEDHPDRLNWKQKFSFAVDAAAGLESLHGSGLVHCDMKSLNILISDAGVAKLADFGLTKTLATVEGKKGKGDTVQQGSLLWQPPELLNFSEVDMKETADIYSFGIVLAELVTESYPFAKELAQEQSRHGVSSSKAVMNVLLNITEADIRPSLVGRDGRVSPSDEFTMIVEEAWQKCAELRPTAHVLRLRLAAAAAAANEDSLFHEALNLRTFTGDVDVAPSELADADTDSSVAKLYGANVKLSFGNCENNAEVSNACLELRQTAGGHSVWSVPLSNVQCVGRFYDGPGKATSADALICVQEASGSKSFVVRSRSVRRIERLVSLINSFKTARTIVTDAQ